MYDANKILNEVLSLTGNSHNSLRIAIGMPKTQPLYDIRDGKIKSISGDLAVKIVKKYPQIDVWYLLTGHGQLTNKYQKVNSETIKQAIAEAQRQLAIANEALGINSGTPLPTSEASHSIDEDSFSGDLGSLGNNKPPLRPVRKKQGEQKDKSENSDS